MLHERAQLLLVEEDPLLSEITAFRLELLGYQVTCVHTGAAVWQQVQESKPDLILLDLTLPDLDGIELLNRLSNDPQTSALPILVLSSESDLESVERAFGAGAEDYLVIPFDLAVLEEKVAALVSPVTSR